VDLTADSDDDGAPVGVPLASAAACHRFRAASAAVVAPVVVLLD
jgi:hypothetical protein